jgi:hypothetical protein
MSSLTVPVEIMNSLPTPSPPSRRSSQISKEATSSLAAAVAAPSLFPSEGFAWSLLSNTMLDGAAVDEWMATTNPPEHFIMKADLQVCTDRGMQTELKNRTCVLTEESWIELKMHGTHEPAPAMPPPTAGAIVLPSREKKHKSLLEIHSIELDPTTPTAFRINFFSGSASSKAKAGFSKMKRLLQVSSSFEDFLKTKIVRCHSAGECSQWMLVLEKLLRTIWQKKFESTILHDSEFYKRHAFVIKQHNDRLLLLSDQWVYNIEASYKPVAIKSIKWSIPVSSFISVTADNRDADLAIMSISFDAAEAKRQFDNHHRNNKTKELVNKHHEFTFRTAVERSKFVASLAAVYWQVTRRKLEVLEQPPAPSK